MATIASNIASARQRIAAACARAGRDPSSVTVICVSKGRDAGSIRQALAAGLRDLGENRIQEARAKYEEFASSPPPARVEAPGRACAQPVWHFIGHVQTNKARDIVAMFDLIHSVDSLHAAAEIDRQAGRIGKVQDILLEVNTSGEESKYGMAPGGLAAFIAGAAPLTNVRVRGLMCMAAATDDPQEARPAFRMLRELRDAHLPGGVLSMGMSGDFEVAVEEGAGLVRLGRILFEG